MTAFVVRQIEKEADKSLEQGQAKYAAYFINTKIYKKYKADVDAKLIEDGYEEVIPVEA